MNDKVVSLSNLAAISDVVLDNNSLSMATVLRFCKVSGITSIVHCFLANDGTLKAFMFKIVSSSSFVTFCENEQKGTVRIKVVNKKAVLIIMVEITANRQGFALAG